MAIGLTLLAELAFLLLLLGLNPALLPQPGPGSSPTLIDIGPERSPVRQEQAKSVAKAKAVAPKADPVPRPPRLAPPPIANPSPSFIPLSSADMAAADIGKLGSNAPGAASAGDSKLASGPGEGPGGAQLYNAEWVVEPSNAQLATYLPKSVDRGSWAMIACKTMARNRVENCQPMGESPAGSGLARAMRLAAWQFQVRPPRIDGKPLVGSWVRIRIDFSEEGKEVR